MLIGISGKMFVGKTYLAKKLAQRFSQFHSDSFARELKELCKIAGSQIDDVVKYSLVYAKLCYYCPNKPNVPAIECLDAPTIGKATESILRAGKEYPNAPNVKNRKLLQIIGTDIIRNTFGKNTWVNEVLKQHQIYENTIVDDVRFDNEANVLDVHIHIDHGANNDLYKQRCIQMEADPEDLAHSSELSLSAKPHFVLGIDYTQDDFETLVKVLGVLIRYEQENKKL